MCERCNRMVALLELTRDGKSWVESTFPNGEPRLVTPEPEPTDGLAWLRRQSKTI